MVLIYAWSEKPLKMNIVYWKINYAQVLLNSWKLWQNPSPIYLLNKYFNFVMKSNKEWVTTIHKAKFLELGYGLVKTTLVLWIMLLYPLFPIRDNSLFWSYGFILFNSGTALIDVLDLVPVLAFGRWCSGFGQIVVTLLWLLKLRTHNWLDGNSHFMIQCIFFVVTDRWILKWIVQGSLN